MNYLQMLLNPNLIALLVMGIQSIHKDAKAGAAKKTLAMESLGLAVAGATVVASQPSADKTADGVSADHLAAQQAASYSIDAAVAAFKAAGQPLFAPAAVPVATAAE